MSTENGRGDMKYLRDKLPILLSIFLNDVKGPGFFYYYSEFGLRYWKRIGLKYRQFCYPRY